MGLFDKFKEIISDNDDDDFDDYDDVTYSREPARDTEEGYSRFGREPKAEKPARKQKNDKVINLRQNAGGMQVILVKPEMFEEAKEIANNIVDGKVVALNLEAANRDVARRIVDFISGVIYATNGNIKKVANSTYVISPYNVPIEGDLISVESNSAYY